MFFRAKLDDSKWEELNRRVISLTKARETGQALKVAKDLLAITRKSYGKKHRCTVVTLGNLGMIYLLQEDLDKAESYYLQALELCETVIGKHSPEYSAITTNLSRVYEAKARQAAGEAMAV